MSNISFEFPLRTVPGNTWPPLVGRLQPLWMAYLELCRSERYEPERIEALQLTQLRALLLHARDNVSHYAEALRDVDLRELQMSDVRRLPILSRLTLQSNLQAFKARSLPPGTKETGKVFTAGSSGVPVEMPQTNMTQLWWQAMNLRDLRWSGVDVRKSLAAIRYYAGNEKQKAALAQGVRLPNWNAQLSELMETGPSYALDIHQDPEKQLAWLGKIAPDSLISYPSNLAILARLALDRGLEFPSIRTVLCISEALPHDTKALLEQAFSASVKNTYSCMEAGYLASPCPNDGGLHVHSENVLFEILDEDGEPCPPGVSGRVVLSTLRNFAAPLIRYEIMDQASWAKNPCGCGIGLPLIDAPWGKRHPPFYLPSGERKNSMGIAVALRKIGGMAQFRVRQTKRDQVEVRVFPDSTWSVDHEHQVVQSLQEFFGAPIEVKVHQMDRPELTQTGKAGHLECEVAEQLRQGEND